VSCNDSSIGCPLSSLVYIVPQESIGRGNEKTGEENEEVEEEKGELEEEKDKRRRRMISCRSKNEEKRFLVQNLKIAESSVFIFSKLFD